MRRTSLSMRALFALVVKIVVVLVLAAVKSRALPKFLRRSLVELGPVYIKLGQVLSTRADLLAKEYIDELSALRENVPPAPHSAMSRVLERSLGSLAREPNEVFARFDERPLASGAVAQVYVAELQTGERVAVKILRPGIRAAIESNFRVLHLIGGWAARLSARVRALNPTAFLDELQELLLAQCDLENELRNYRRFEAAFAGDSEIAIPRVHAELTSSDVLVMEYVDAIKPHEFRRLGIPPLALAKKIDTLFDIMIFGKGLCHADLHPGNFFWNKNGQIVLIDLGLVHEIPPEESRHFATFYYSVIDGFFEFAASYLVDFLLQRTAASRPHVEKQAARDLGEAIRREFEDTDGRPRFSEIFRSLMEIAVREGLQFRATYSKMCLTTVTVEGYLYSLDPTFDMMENARSKRLDLARYTSIPAEAEKLIFGDFGTYSTALFRPGASAETAFDERDSYVLETLALAPGELLLDVGCGRGRLLEKATQRGAHAVGITISEDERNICLERGSECILSSWENFDLDHVGAPLADAIAVVEMFNHVATMHENLAGLMQLRLDRFFDWSAGRLKPGGKLFVQSLCVGHHVLTDPAYRTELDELCRRLPFAGFPSLQQILLAAGRRFVVHSVVDHSDDVVHTYRFLIDRVDQNESALRGLIRSDVFDVMYTHVKFLLELAERRVLGLNRILLGKVCGASKS